MICSTLLNWIYPKQCILCMEQVVDLSQLFCFNCFIQLPYTEDHLRYLENQQEDADLSFHQSCHKGGTQGCNPPHGVYSGDGKGGIEKRGNRFGMRSGAVKMPLSLIEQRLNRTAYRYAHALLRYDRATVLPKLFHLIKSAGEGTLLDFFGRYHGAQLKKIPHYQSIQKPDYIIPIPLHPTRAAERGYNQSAIWAHALSKQLAIPVVEDWLIKIRQKAVQSELKRKERWANVIDSFMLLPHAAPKGKAVILVDDIVTTGATWSYCSELLWSAGASRVDCVVLAIRVDS